MPPARRAAVLAALWFCGWGLRLTILATPPVIPHIQRDLGLSGTQIGILTGLPVVFFAAVAVPGSLLIARAGVVSTLVFGLLLTAAGSGLRALAPAVHPLYLATMLMAAGIALMQPAMPAAVRRWLPEHIGLGTAVYTNGLIVGEIVAVSTMLPVVMPLVGDSWRPALALWSAPVVLIAGLTLLLAPRTPADDPRDAAATRAPWWPDWRDPLVWRLGLILASVNTMYFCTNGFLPGYLESVRRPDLISGGLTALNFGQLPASLLLLVAAGRLERRVWPYVASSLLALFSIGALISTASGFTVLWAGLLGFACGAALALGLALSPLLSEPSDVPRVSAGMFTISYLVAMLVSVLAGATWDATGTARAAFLPIAVAALPAIALTPTLRFTRPGPRAGR
jgi:CP family cyanate transporter-like MFS transporter